MGVAVSFGREFLDAHKKKTVMSYRTENFRGDVGMWSAGVQSMCVRNRQ